jgi:hypothetical protein
VRGPACTAATVDVEPGRTWSYKFVVDGKWLYDNTVPWFTDSFGNINNMVFIDPSTGQAVTPTPPVQDSSSLLSPPAVHGASTTGVGGGRVSPSFDATLDTPVAAGRSRSPSSDGGSGAGTDSVPPSARHSKTLSSPSEIAEWIETAGGFNVPGSERRRRMSTTSTAAAQAERDIVSEFHLSVKSMKRGMHRSVSAASLDAVSADSRGLSSPIVGTPELLRFTPAQATVRKEGKLILALVGPYVSVCPCARMHVWSCGRVDGCMCVRVSVGMCVRVYVCPCRRVYRRL